MLALKPRRPHWWHMTFRPAVRGLSTGPIPFGEGFFEVLFNFVDHRLEVYTHEDSKEAFDLADGLPVADFYTQLFELLHKRGIHVDIRNVPYDLPINTPFQKIADHRAYDAVAVASYWRALSRIAGVFEKYASGFSGKVSPAQLYWHHMDLAVARLNGKRGPVFPADASSVEKDAYSHQVVSAGFWAGDDKVRIPAFYSYTYPSPDGLEKERIEPRDALWDSSSGSPMAFLPYDVVREAKDPVKTLTSFLETTYEAGARLAGWDMEALRYIAP